MKAVELKALDPKVPPVPMLSELLPMVKVPEPVAIVTPLNVLAVTSPISLRSGAKDKVTAVVPEVLI